MGGRRQWRGRGVIADRVGPMRLGSGVGPASAGRGKVESFAARPDLEVAGQFSR